VETPKSIDEIISLRDFILIWAFFGLAFVVPNKKNMEKRGIEPLAF
jgi:hypothetical protein